ncbi:MAG: hypothetical protein RLZ81_803 [Pseudomonadota bacterium]|jgi:hypothetical protein
MTELRDARLKRALDHAPDAALRPSDATRAAIKSIASEANAGALPAPAPRARQAPLWHRVARWWRAGESGSRHMPWNAALATVVLASVVTLMWFDQPVPQAVPDDAPAKAAEQIPAASSVPASVPPPAVALDVPPPPLQDASRMRAPAKRADLGARQATQPRPEPLAKTADAPAEPKSEAAPPLAAAPMPAAAPAVAKALAAPSESKPALADKEKRRVEGGLAAGSRAPAPPSGVDWSELSVRRLGSPHALTSGQASRLLALLQAVSLRAAQAGDPVVSAANRLELSRHGEPVATLDLDQRWLRWTPVGAEPGTILTGRASVAQWQAIQDELARLGWPAP